MKKETWKWLKLDNASEDKMSVVAKESSVIKENPSALYEDKKTLLPPKALGYNMPTEVVTCWEGIA